jgi:hypothetical protein
LRFLRARYFAIGCRLQGQESQRFSNTLRLVLLSTLSFEAVAIADKAEEVSETVFVSERSNFS